jgi:uncharacterized protein
MKFGDLIDLDVKLLSDAGEFTGYASVFENEDQGRDIVMPGAFAKSLQTRPAAKVKMLRQHDQSEPIGVWLDLREDSKGLKVTGRLIRETVKGAETYELIKAGALDGLSIGFRTIKDRLDRAKGVRLLEEVEVREISIVTFPMNDRALVSTVKAADHDRARAIVRAIDRVKEALK